MSSDRALTTRSVLLQKPAKLMNLEQLMHREPRISRECKPSPLEMLHPKVFVFLQTYLVLESHEFATTSHEQRFFWAASARTSCCRCRKPWWEVSERVIG